MVSQVQQPAVHSSRIPQGQVLLVASFGAFLAFLDATIVNVAFPSIRSSFPETSVSTLSWVLNAYNIVFAAFLILCGRLTDLLGRRRMFVGGVALFTLASVLCGLAPSVGFLIGVRMLQAVGAAMLVPASLGLVIAAYPVKHRAHAIGIWGAAGAVAAGLGPPIGGGLVELGNWRWAFFVNLPLGLVALALARPRLVESRAPGRRLVPDLAGAVLVVAGVALLNLGIVKGSDWGWGSWQVIAALVGAVVLLGAFALSSRRSKAPMIDPTLLRLPSFAISTVATVVAGVGFYAYLLTNILWLQYVWKYSVLDSGLAVVPGALVAAVVAARLGPLAERIGYRWFVVPGALIWAAAYLWYHQEVGLEPSFWAQWLPGQILSGIGVGATLPLLGSAGLAAVPGGRYATASAVVSAARQLGGVIGIAVLVVILGEPTPASMVGSLRDGWMLSIVAFALVAVVGLFLGTYHATADDADVDDAGSPPRVLGPLPAPAATEAASLVHGLRTAGEVRLADVPLFRSLTEDARAQLAEGSRVIEVPAGSVLMTEGDPAGAAYVVRTGRLEVLVGEEAVREVGPGEVLGELGLLTGEPRSATIRARRDATLLEVPRAAFEAVLAGSPDAAHYVLTQLADRLRTAGVGSTSASVRQPVSVIAVVGDGPGAPVVAVADALVARLSGHHRTARFDDAHQAAADALVRAERENERTVLVAADEQDVAWREFCLRQADAVVRVALADTQPPSVPESWGASRRQVEVVLIGADHGMAAAWAAAVDAWQVTLVTGDIEGGVRRLGDRLAGRSLGVVISGGGARAIAGVGLLRELEESGFQVDRLAGASMGGLVAATYATGCDGAELEDSAYLEFVRSHPFGDYRLSTTSLLRGQRVRNGLIRHFGVDTVIEGLPRQLSLVSTDLISRTRQVHRRGNLVDAASATCRLPAIFPPIPTPDGRLLVDGGVMDNMPTDLLFERDEGPVVAMAISSGGERPPRQGPPRIPALPDTLMRTLMINSGGVVETARQLGAWVVTPPTLGVGLLEFHQFDRMVEAGRAAARALIAESGGDFSRH